MLNPSQFRDLISGRRQGWWSACLRCALRIAEVPYTWAVSWRNRRYDRGKAEIHRAAAPVISVGNLTLGGTGKTPMVRWVARWLRNHDVRVTIISRGYGAEADSQNDEALELEENLPDVPHLQDPDRVAAARIAVEELDCQLILLDDGMQHRRMGRDLEIVLIDALEPFGFGHVFPRGTLREPLSGLRRADVVVLTRADMLSTEQRMQIWESVERYVADCNVADGAFVAVEASHAPDRLITTGGQELPLESLAGQRVAAFCGIGNPEGFRHTLDTCGYEVAAFREFPDHHRYTRDDVDSLGRWAEALDVSAVLCTHKDLVKLRLERLGPHPLHAVRIGMQILGGEEALGDRLLRLVSS